MTWKTNEEITRYLLTAIVCTTYLFLSSLLLAHTYDATLRGFLLT